MRVPMKLLILVFAAVGAFADLKDVFLLRNAEPIKIPLNVTVSKVIEAFNNRRICDLKENKKACETCLPAKRIHIILQSEREHPIPGLEDFNHTDAMTENQDIIKISVIMLNNLLTLRSSCTEENIKKGFIGNCRNYSDCYAQLINAIPEGPEHDDHIQYDIEFLLKKTKPNYKPHNPFKTFSAVDVLDRLHEANSTYQNMSQKLAVFSIISGYLFDGYKIEVMEYEKDFLDDIFLHYGVQCGNYIPQTGFQKLLTDLQMQRQGEHIDHEALANSCSVGMETAIRRDIVDHTLDSGTTRDNTNEKEEIEFNATETQNEKTMYSNQRKRTVIASSLVESKEKEVDYEKATKLSSQSRKETVTTSVVQTNGSVNVSEKGLVGAYQPLRSQAVLLTNMENSTKIESSTGFPSFLYQDVITGLESLSAKLVTIDVPKSYSTETIMNFQESSENTTKQKKIRRSPKPHHEFKHRNLANECLTPSALLQQFSISAEDAITQDEFIQICPALVQQAVSGVCKFKATSDIETDEFNDATVNASFIENGLKKPSKYNILYALAAVSGITMASVLGVFFMPVLNKPIYDYISGFFVGLAFGTMTGDVTVHIIPQYLGIHVHEEVTAFSWSHAFPESLQLQITFLLTVYGLILFSSTLAMIINNSNPREDDGHSHLNPEIVMEVLSASSVDTTKTNDAPQNDEENTNKTSAVFYGFTSAAIIIILADTLHNFADGLAIAVSFATSPKDGVSASIAIFFHELPHEIADFVVLLSTGLSVKKAFFANILSGLLSFVGLGIGIVSAAVWRKWLLAITGGLFIYVAMAEILPELKSKSGSGLVLFAVKQFGVLCGILIMIAISIYENSF